jgi:hypothetical protein
VEKSCESLSEKSAGQGQDQVFGHIEGQVQGWIGKGMDGGGLEIVPVSAG